MSKEVKRYDCTDGGARFCQGCYTMSECEFGEYVSWDDYKALLAERDALKKDAERYRGMRAVVIAELEGCTEELYDSECDRLIEVYDAALQGEQP